MFKNNKYCKYGKSWRIRRYKYLITIWKNKIKNQIRKNENGKKENVRSISIKGKDTRIQIKKPNFQKIRIGF